jgi:hypothetical protein
MRRFHARIARNAMMTAVCICVWTAATSAVPADNATKPRADDLVADLVARGIQLESGATIRLPAPQMPDGLSSDQQQAALLKAAGKYPLHRFLRDSVVAPFALEIKPVDDAAGKRHAQHVDFCFVAYGSLAAVIDRDLFGELAGAQEAGSQDQAQASARALTPDELRALGLAAEKTSDREESFVALDVPILNRVQLRGVGFGIRERRAESVVGAMKLDDRFRNDPDFPNTWSPITHDAQGKLSVGKPLPYAGIGGYMKMTPLHEPSGALFVECHIAFDEPEAWFGGKNLLRAKLPLVVQDNVRTFRRKLKESR